MKKGMQMVQNPNDGATSKVNKPDDKSENDNAKQQSEQNNQKRVHWSRMQLQGECGRIQSCDKLKN